jgi:hypothetical protein
LSRGEQADTDEFQSNSQPYRAHNKIFGNQAEESAGKEKQFRNGELLVGAKESEFIFEGASPFARAWADMGCGCFRVASERGRKGRNRKREGKPSRRSLVT